MSVYFHVVKMTQRMIFERILNHIKIKSHVWSKLERYRINN